MMDQTILEAFPMVVATRNSPMEQATKYGTRFIGVATGVDREITLPWIQVRHHIAHVISDVRMPYGESVESVNLICGPIPVALIKEFIADARQACPVEVAGAIIWNQQTNEWRYAKREATSSSSGHIDFNEIVREDGDNLVVDVHSHGRSRAFFSPKDDQDDMGTMRLSLVVGNVDRPIPSTCMRLCMAGYIQPAVIQEDGTLKVGHHEK